MLEEDVLEVNHEDRIFRYGIPEQPIMPVENIFGTMKVLEAGNNQATIEWTAEFEVQPEKEAEAKQMFEEAYGMGIQGIENYILAQEVVQSYSHVPASGNLGAGIIFQTITNAIIFLMTFPLHLLTP